MRSRRAKSAGATPPAEKLPEYAPRGGVLPPVLTVAAVAKGLMPALGESGLPESIAKQIPLPLRYWKAETAERAREVRDELVERRLIRPDQILMVSGEPRVVVWRAFLMEPDLGSTAPLIARTSPGVAAGACLAETEKTVSVFELDATDPDVVADLAKRRLESAAPWIAVYADAPATRALLAKATGLHAFALATRPGLLFASTEPLGPDAGDLGALVLEEESASEILAKSALGRARFFKAAEERFVMGVVLEPDVIDSQSDTYSAEDVRKAAHAFMADYAQIGQQHEAIVTGKVKILESYIAPVDFQVGSETVKKGTWLLGARVVDDALWTAVKEGDFTGWSIGGTAVRTPEATPPAA